MLQATADEVFKEVIERVAAFKKAAIKRDPTLKHSDSGAGAPGLGEVTERGLAFSDFLQAILRMAIRRFRKIPSVSLAHMLHEVVVPNAHKARPALFNLSLSGSADVLGFSNAHAIGSCAGYMPASRMRLAAGVRRPVLRRAVRAAGDAEHHGEAPHAAQQVPLQVLRRAHEADHAAQLVRQKKGSTQTCVCPSNMHLGVK
eukprot:1177605-Prorocentrum_minimum.AAC.1